MTDERWESVANSIGFTLVGLVVGFALWLVGTLSEGANTDRRWRLEAIEHGFALYCPVTGEWAWKDQCPTADEHTDKEG